jgi:hypothetical protein
MPTVFSPHTYTTIFVEALIGLIIHARGKKVEQRITAFERQSQQFNA